MRLIDADAFIKKMEWYRDKMVDIYGENDEYAKCLSSVITKVDIAPTIDAVPVKHGKWIWMGEQGDSRHMCSVCKGKEKVPTIMGEPIVWEYCPNCGAKMDGERKD